MLEMGEHYKNTPSVDSENMKVARNCVEQLSRAYNQIQKDKRAERPLWLERMKQGPTLPIGTGEQGRLMSPTQVLKNDLPKEWLERYGLDQPNHPFYRPRAGQDALLEALGLPNLSSRVHTTFQSFKGQSHPLDLLTQRLKTLSPALLRLVYHTSKTKLDALQKRLTPAQFYQVPSVSVKVVVEGFADIGVSVVSLDYGFDRSTKQLLVNSADATTCSHAVAEMLEISTGTDLMALMSVWSLSLPEALKLLDSSRVATLPEEFILDAVPSIAYEPEPVSMPDTDIPVVAHSATTPSAAFSDDDAGEAASAGPTTSPSNPFNPTATALTPSPSSESNSSLHSLPRTGSLNESQSTSFGGQGARGPSGSTSPSSYRGPQTRFRNYVYVRSSEEAKVREETETDTHAREVDRRGMERVMEFERSQGRAPEDISQDFGAGYDIRSSDAHGTLRYIELKTVSREWGGRGVTLSDNQFRTGLQYQNRYFLYVLEDLDGDTKLHLICNPAGLANQFAYAEEWRDLAEEAFELD